MRIRDTKLGAWAALCRLQSTPLTWVILLLGYGTAGGDILSTDVLPLLAVGALGHWSVYAMNDHLDMYHDRFAGKLHKPLPAGEISETAATFFVTVGLLSSCVACYVWLGASPALYWIAAVLTGIWYNIRSKTDWFSAIYLSVWAILVVAVGANYYGEPTWQSFLFGAAIAIHMFIMTLEGGLKDLPEGEPCIPRVMGCGADGDRLFVSFNFAFLFYSLHITETIVLILSTILSGASTWTAGLVAFFMLISGFISFELMKPQEYNPKMLKMNIVIYTCLSLAALASASVPVIGGPQAFALAVDSLVWGLGVQFVLYNNPLYFP